MCADQTPKAKPFPTKSAETALRADAAERCFISGQDVLRLHENGNAPSLAEPVSASFPIHSKAVLFEGTPLPDLSAELAPGPGRPRKREKGKHEKRKKHAKTEADFL
jgi:hypothetical protein